MDDTPQWIHLACQRWGGIKCRIWSGGDWYVDKAGYKRQHVDGYARSFLGKLMEERYGSGHRELMRAQFWAEVFLGDALDIQRAMPGMPEIAFFAIHLQYVFDREFHLTGSEKAALVGLSARSYWRGVQMAKVWLWSRLEPGQANQQLGHNIGTPQPAEPSGKDFQPPLQSSPKKARNTSILARVPELCLKSLHRPTLTLPPRPTRTRFTR